MLWDSEPPTSTRVVQTFGRAELRRACAILWGKYLELDSQQLYAKCLASRVQIVKRLSLPLKQH